MFAEDFPRESGFYKEHGGDVYSHPGVLDFSANINPLGPPEAVIRAAEESLKNIHRYPDVQQRELLSALSDAEDIPREWLICGNGAAELIFSVVQTLRPRSALLTAPAFREYERALKAAGLTEQTVRHEAGGRVEKNGERRQRDAWETPAGPRERNEEGKKRDIGKAFEFPVGKEGMFFYCAQEADGYQLKEDILGLLTADMDLLFLCNPNNPTGQLIDPDLLRKIADRCLKNKIFLVLDECFLDFADPPEKKTGRAVSEKDSEPGYFACTVSSAGAKPTPGLSLKPLLAGNPYLLILKSFTKLYAMPGLRLGYGMTSNQELIKAMRRVVQPWNLSIPAQAAGAAALKETDYVQQTRELIRGERIFLKEGLERAGLRVYDPAANYLFFKGPEGLASRLLDQGILIRDCSGYRGLDAGCYRVAVRRREENRILLGGIKKVLQR